LPTVYLGNVSPLDGGRLMRGPQTTQVVFMDNDDLATRMRTVTHVDGLWIRHSTQPPAWVQSDDEDLELALAEHYECPTGRPQDWHEFEGAK
jgi:hypothetical protein